ncbi:hypothetical protein Tco_1300882 [Tanacetum coccineum]
MMMCKQAEQGVPLQAEQADWLEDTDEEIDEQELEAHYSYMAKIQEVSPEESSSTGQPLEQVQNHDESNVYDNVRRHSEQPESINDTYVLEKDDSNVTPDSSNICTNDNQVDQNVVECVDERDALANLTLDTEENKTILKQLKKANASLTQELEKCKTNLDETNSALGELNETLGLLALKDIEIKEGLKTKAYEISVLNQKHDELVKKSLLTRSQLEGYLKENTKVISDLKVKEEKDIDKMIEMDKQLKFLNEIVYTRNQSIQTIHMLAPKCATYNGRLTFANPSGTRKESISKSRQVFNDMTFNINQFIEIVDQTWRKHTSSCFRVPTAHDMELLIKTLLMPLSIKSQNDSFRFEHELKTEMHEDFEYVKSLENEVDELESEKADFSNMYDLLIEECVSKDVICSYLHSMSELNAHTELQCMYLHKVQECECLAQKLSKQTESVNNEDVNARKLRALCSAITASKPKRKAKQFCVALPIRKVASNYHIQKSKSYYKGVVMRNKKQGNGKWWIAYRDGHRIIQLILFIVDSGCTKHMTGNLKVLCNFCETILGTVRFGNDQFAPILGYGD